MDESQKEGSNLLKMLHKKGEFPQKSWVSNPGGTMVNHILKTISISHCLDISHVFLHLIFKPFIFIDVIKILRLFITYKFCNNFVFIFNLEKLQSYRRNNSIQAGIVNAKL